MFLAVMGTLIVGFMLGAILSRAFYTPHHKEVVRVPGGDRALRATVDSARRIVQFAVGNLDPRTIRGWPYQDLREYSTALRMAYPHDQLMIELCDELDRFEIEARELELERGPLKRGFHGQVLHAPEELTGEAKEVWARAMGHFQQVTADPPTSGIVQSSVSGEISNDK